MPEGDLPIALVENIVGVAIPSRLIGNNLFLFREAVWVIDRPIEIVMIDRRCDFIHLLAAV